MVALQQRRKGTDGAVRQRALTEAIQIIKPAEVPETS